MSVTQPRVALFGLGLMGQGMARRLLGAGFPLTVYNRNREKALALAAEGAVVADSPREAAAGADIIVSMVADDAGSRALWLGENGALAAAKPGAVLIESSTLTVGWVHELAAAVAARGGDFLDAPVTGSRTQAAAGELCFLVGGSADVLEKARPALAVMSRAIVHLGPTGSGALLKLINNFLCGVQVVSLAEALGVIEKSGLDRAKALEILVQGAPGSPLFKNISARMTAPAAAPHFHLRLMMKDLGYAFKEGKNHGLHLATAEAAHAVFQQALAAGLGDRDMSAVIELFRANSNTIEKKH
jgi:3-hydroxyisobutyrate dehydrogenase